MSKKKVSIKLEIGTVYQKEAGGTYYFRYQVNTRRKAMSLKTKNQKEALKKANEFIPLIKADSNEIIAAHVQHAKDLKRALRPLTLAEAWDIYDKHPDRARPSTLRQYVSYRCALNQLIDFLANLGHGGILISEVTYEMAEAFSKHLKEEGLSVSTHNLKMKQLRKVFTVLSDYTDTNPFLARQLLRSKREEQEALVRRRNFSLEQERELLLALKDENFKMPYKDEVHLLYCIGMFSGQRLKDCVLLQWEQLNLDLNRLWVKQFKTGKKVSIPVASPILNELIKLEHRTGYVLPTLAKLYLKRNEKNYPIGQGELHKLLAMPIKWIGLETTAKMEGRKQKVCVYGFHSLRHSFASHCAHIGVPKAVVVSILGANSKIIDEYYTHVGEEAQNQAIELISQKGNEKFSLQKRVQKALEYIEFLESPCHDLQQLKKILSD